MLLLNAGATMTVNVAPDQPVPFVYLDDPLIIEFLADSTGTATGVLELTGDATPALAIPLDAMTLKAGQVYWKAVEAVPGRQDRYLLEVNIGLNGDTYQATGSFCHIARPDGATTYPVGADVQDWISHLPAILTGVPMNSIRLDSAMAGLESHVDSAARSSMEVTLAVDVANQSTTDIEALATLIGSRVHRWEFESSYSAAGLNEAVTALRKAGIHAPIGLVLESPEAVAAALNGGAGKDAAYVVYRHDAPVRAELDAFRLAAEQAGYEGIPVHSLGRGTEPDAGSPGERTVRQLILNRAAGVRHDTLSFDALYATDGFGAAYAPLSGLVHQLAGSRYVGELPFEPPVYAQLFFGSDAVWTLVLWTTGEEQAISLEVPSAELLALTDARNNPLRTPKPADGRVDIAVRNDPVYLRGRGGALVQSAAWQIAQHEARDFIEQAEAGGTLPEELTATVTRIAQSTEGRTNRLDFFALLQAFPILERDWHAEILSRADAAPAMASLARLVRALAIVEQESGEAFVEPLHETLARCREFQTLYLTSAGGDPGTQERGTWLNAEVNRLIAESEALTGQGRGIEANAVATLAEWRSRALEHTLEALPLSRPGNPRNDQKEERR